MDDHDVLGDVLADYDANREERMPIILVVDGSAEMQHDGAIDCLNRGILRFVEAMQGDPVVSGQVEVKIVRFGGRVDEVSEWSMVGEFIPPRIEPCGDRPIGSAIALAMQLVEERLAHIKAQNMDRRRPRIFLVSAGEPSDHGWEDVAREAREGNEKGRFWLYPISLVKGDGAAHSAVLGNFHKGGKYIEATFADLATGKPFVEFVGAMHPRGLSFNPPEGAYRDVFGLANSSFDEELPVEPPTQDLVNNREERWPCILVVDASESMVKSGAAQALEQAIGYFSRVLKHDPVASAKVQIQVVNYGETIESAGGWSDAMYFVPAPIPAQRSTRTGLAMRHAMRLAAEQVEHLKSHHIDHRQPIIYLFSDGLPADEDWQDAARAVREGEAAGAFTVSPVSLVVDQGETVHTEALRRFSADGRCDEVPVGDAMSYFGKVILPPLASVAFSCPDDGSGLIDGFALAEAADVEPAEWPVERPEEPEVWSLEDFSDGATTDDKPDYEDNRVSKLPCVLVLDASGSMNRDGAIDELNKAIAAFVDNLKDDLVAASIVQLKIIRVGGTVDDLGDWTEAASFVPPVLKAGGNTPTGEGVELAMRAINEQREVLRGQGVDCRTPWIWLISDGLPTDANWQDVARRAREAQKAGEFYLYPVTLITDPGYSAHTRALQSFNKDNTCLKIQTAELEACFGFVRQSAEANAAAESGMADAEFVEQATGRGLDLDRTDPIGEGYLSTVHAHPRDGAACVKLYTTADAAKWARAKIQAMLARPPAAIRSSSGIAQIVWPTSAVLRNGEFAGFVMPRLEKGLWSFDKLDSPLARRQQRAPDNLRYRLLALHNLALLLDSLHAREHFVIDLEPRNIWVHRWTPDSASPHAGHVVLTGCEGFSIAGTPGGSQRFHAEVIMEDYCSPYMIDPVTLSFDSSRVAGFEREQDMWAFALNAFRMLNHGLKPWDARAKPHVRNPPDAKYARIAALDRSYAYGAKPNTDFEPLATSRHVWFDPRLVDLFERTFRSAKPQPTLAEWIDVLRRLLHSSQRCEASADHWKLGAECGECAVRARSA